MSKTFDTYCIDTADLESARGRIEAALPVQFVLHESTYWGGNYYLASSNEFGKITIRRNHNSYTGKLNEPDHPGCEIVVYVSASPDPDTLTALLMANGLRLLNHTVV